MCPVTCHVPDGTHLPDHSRLSAVRLRHAATADNQHVKCTGRPGGARLMLSAQGWQNLEYSRVLAQTLAAANGSGPHAAGLIAHLE